MTYEIRSVGGANRKMMNAGLLFRPEMLLLLLVVGIFWIKSARASDPGADEKGHQIPFAYDPLRCPYLVVPVSINGRQPISCAVDTGTTLAFSVDEKVAKALGLKAVGNVHTTVNGSVALPAAAVSTVTILGDAKSGSAVFHPQWAYLADMTYLQQGIIGQKVEGIIGLGLLKSMAVSLDFHSKTMTLIPHPEVPRESPTVTILPLIESPDTEGFYVRLTPATGLATNVLLDTGTATTSIPLPTAIQLQPQAMSGSFYLRIDALYYAQDMLMSKMRIGNFEEPNVVLSSIPLPATPTCGLNILSRFLVTLDFAHKRMVLERPHQPVAPQQPTGWTGIRLKQDGNGFLVKRVQDGSPAKAAGVQEGDRLVSIDGYPVEGHSIVVASRLRDGFAGTTATLALQRGDAKPQLVSFVRKSMFDASKDAIDGMTLKKPNDQPITILGIAKGCSADRAGLQVGDQIISIGGIPVATMAIEQFADQVTQPSLPLIIRRPGEASDRAVELVGDAASK